MDRSLALALGFGKMAFPSGGVDSVTGYRSSRESAHTPLYHAAGFENLAAYLDRLSAGSAFQTASSS